MTKRIKLKLEEEIEMLYAQLDVKEAMIKNYTAEIEIQRQQLEIAIKCLRNYKSGTTDKWFAEVALEQIKELDK